MNAARLRRLVVWDIRVQLREHIYAFTAFTTAAFAVVAYLLPADAPVSFVTGILFLDPAVVGVGFVGALILLERSQQTLPALAVTPASPAEYVVAKLLTFTALTVVGGGVVVTVWGWPLSMPLAGRMLLALTSTGVVAVLAGLVLVATANSVNHLIARMVPVAVVANLPLLAHFGIVTGWPAWLLFGINPGHAMLRALYWAAEPDALTRAEVVYAFGYLTLLAAVLMQRAVRLHTRTIGHVGS
ncbi:MAG: fluoroquinolone export ABC transporter permease subunit [Gemmatimonadales bacterium]